MNAADPRAAKPAADAPAPADRITVALIPKAADDLASYCARTRHSKTDAVNRAVSLLEFADAEMAAGRDLLVRDGETGETQVVRFL